MPGEKEDTEEQNSFFGGAFTFLIYLIVFSTILGFLTSVFNFYNFNYTQYYSVVFFYLFLMTCTFILPDRMIGVDPPVKTITSSIKDFSTGVGHLAGVTLGWQDPTKKSWGETAKSWASSSKSWVSSKFKSNKTASDGSEKKSWFSFGKGSDTKDGSEKKSWFSSSKGSDGTGSEKKSWFSFGSKSSTNKTD